MNENKTHPLEDEEEPLDSAGAMPREGVKETTEVIVSTPPTALLVRTGLEVRGVVGVEVAGGLVTAVEEGVAELVDEGAVELGVVDGVVVGVPVAEDDTDCDVGGGGGGGRIGVVGAEAEVGGVLVLCFMLGTIIQPQSWTHDRIGIVVSGPISKGFPKGVAGHSLVDILFELLWAPMYATMNKRMCIREIKYREGLFCGCW